MTPRMVDGNYRFHLDLPKEVGRLLLADLHSLKGRGRTEVRPLPIW